MSTIRLRRPNVRAVVESLDAFPKIHDTVKEEKNITGGAIGFLCSLLIIWLVINEIMDYFTPRMRYKFAVDSDFNARMQLDIDLTVAMPCEMIGADIMDATDQPVVTTSQLRLEPTTFELSTLQRHYWDLLKKSINERRPDRFNSLDNLLFVAGNVLRNMAGEKSEKAKQDAQKDACRISGAVNLNKVAGNFHVTVGKSLPLPGGVHAHMAVMFFGDAMRENFSHRIERFSFGPRTSGLVNPLDGTEKTSGQERMMYQYYIKVVPTAVHSFHSDVVRTCQYSVTQRDREISHAHGSHGQPGIYFKYDMSPLGVEVFDDHPPLWKLLVRLCAVVGGVFATSGVLNMVISFLVNLVCCSVFQMPTQKSVAHVQNGVPLHAIINGPSDHQRGHSFDM